MNIPNAVTAARLLLTPVFALLYLRGQQRAALAVLLLAAASDLLDGFLARRLDMVTALGKALDPVADKLMQLTMMLCAAARLPRIWPLLGLHALRELTLGVLSLRVLRRTGRVCGARWYGKLCTAVLYTVMPALLVWEGMPVRLQNALIALCAWLIALCLLLYAARFLRILRQGPERLP